MKAKSAKCFFLFRIFIGVLIVLCIWSQFRYKPHEVHLKNETLKYILQWTLPDTIPFVYMGKGQQTFLKRKCFFQNCFVTSDRTYFDDIRKFDAIVFHGPEIDREDIPGPLKRSSDQLYIFVSMESSHYYPVFKKKYNGFFNWTWTYRLDSNVSYDYLKIRDNIGNVIGPKEVMHWTENITETPLNGNVKVKLQTKNKAAAWIVSNCESLSNRENIGKELLSELSKYDLELDVYGRCGIHECPKEMMQHCLDVIQEDYYFYLSFENSFSDDYVTEKLLHALKHYAVPVVYGSANYSRFMPDGIYLNIKELGVKEVANRMYELIQDKEKYYNYFKWHNFYSYHDPDEAPDIDDYCRLCAMLNDEKLTKTTTVYDEFIEWWTRDSL